MPVRQKPDRLCAVQQERRVLINCVTPNLSQTSRQESATARKISMSFEEKRLLKAVA